MKAARRSSPSRRRRSCAASPHRQLHRQRVLPPSTCLAKNWGVSDSTYTGSSSCSALHALISNAPALPGTQGPAAAARHGTLCSRTRRHGHDGHRDAGALRTYKREDAVDSPTIHPPSPTSSVPLRAIRMDRLVCAATRLIPSDHRPYHQHVAHLRRAMSAPSTARRDGRPPSTERRFGPTRIVSHHAVRALLHLRLCG